MSIKPFIAEMPFVLQSEYLTIKPTAENAHPITISWMKRPVTGISKSSTAECGPVLQFDRSRE